MALVLNQPKLNDIDDWKTFLSPKIRISEIPTIEDPLVLSCTLFRFADPKSKDHDPMVRLLNLISHQNQILKKTTEADRVLANEIRKYYRGKFLFLRLRGENFTKFRKDLAQFV